MGTSAHNVRCILEVSSFDEILLKVCPEGLTTCSHVTTCNHMAEELLKVYEMMNPSNSRDRERAIKNRRKERDVTVFFSLAVNTRR